jgi:hypothetical protein
MKTLFALATILTSTVCANAGTYVIYDEPVYYAPPARVYYAPPPAYYRPPVTFRRPPTYSYAPVYCAPPAYYGAPAIGFSFGGGWSRVNVVIR